MPFSSFIRDALLHYSQSQLQSLLSARSRQLLENSRQIRPHPPAAHRTAPKRKTYRRAVCFTARPFRQRIRASLPLRRRPLKRPARTPDSRSIACTSRIESNLLHSGRSHRIAPSRLSRAARKLGAKQRPNARPSATTTCHLRLDSAPAPSAIDRLCALFLSGGSRRTVPLDE